MIATTAAVDIERVATRGTGRGVSGPQPAVVPAMARRAEPIVIPMLHRERAEATAPPAERDVKAADLTVVTVPVPESVPTIAAVHQVDPVPAPGATGAAKAVVAVVSPTGEEVTASRAGAASNGAGRHPIDETNDPKT